MLPGEVSKLYLILRASRMLQVKKGTQHTRNEARTMARVWVALLSFLWEYFLLLFLFFSFFIFFRFWHLPPPIWIPVSLVKTFLAVVGLCWENFSFPDTNILEHLEQTFFWSKGSPLLRLVSDMMQESTCVFEWFSAATGDDSFTELLMTVFACWVFSGASDILFSGRLDCELNAALLHKVLNILE